MIETGSFSYEGSYGFNEEVLRNNNEVADFSYALRNSDAIVEYHGEPPDDSVFEPAPGRCLVDDLLAFISLYSGVYCQYLWKEHRNAAKQFSATTAMRLSFFSHNDEWAGSHHKATDHFDRALTVIPTLDRTQFSLAIRWFFSALREFEIGRPLVEAALNWVCLESQANYLTIAGTKFQKVRALLNTQGFPVVPLLDDVYKLRNDAFHDGALSNLSEAGAQRARLVGRTLVRAQILNMIGMPHSVFRPEFVTHYAT